MFNKLFCERNNMMPLRKAIPYCIAFIVISIIVIVSQLINGQLPNERYYKVEIKGRVTDIFRKHRKSFFKLEKKWFLIKTDYTTDIAIGDSLYKKENSYDMFLYGKYFTGLKFIFKEVNVLYKEVKDPRNNY